MTKLPLTFAWAFLLGLLHSLEPSHAKAVLATYFLNRQRTIVEAIAFAATVTLAHTLSIYALALLGYALGPLFPKERLGDWSEMLGGTLMMGIGVWMFWAERRAGYHTRECCGQDHAHGHLFHHSTYHHDHSAPTSLRQAFVLGFCSGAIPCMSGLTVLLMAWTSGSPSRGLGLVAVFSLGLGLVVLALCLAMRQMAQVMERYWKSAERWGRVLPLASAFLIFMVGMSVVAHNLPKLWNVAR